jgi:hypothetical protein
VKPEGIRGQWCSDGVKIGNIATGFEDVNCINLIQDSIQWHAEWQSASQEGLCFIASATYDKNYFTSATFLVFDTTLHFCNRTLKIISNRELLSSKQIGLSPFYRQKLMTLVWKVLNMEVVKWKESHSCILCSSTPHAMHQWASVWQHM